MVEVRGCGCVVPFHTAPPLSAPSTTHSSYHPQCFKGMALQSDSQALPQKGAVESTPPDPSFYSQMFVHTKPLGDWLLFINLSWKLCFIHGFKGYSGTKVTLSSSLPSLNFQSSFL